MTAPLAPTDREIDSETGEMAWARLVPRLLQLRQRLDAIEAAKRAPRDPDLGEQALAAEQDEVTEAIAASLHAKLDEAEAALHRIAAGTYGRCADCGAPIAEVRLRALPTALRCTACEARASTARVPTTQDNGVSRRPPGV